MTETVRGTAGAAAFIPFALPDITEAEIAAVVGAMRSGWLTTGPNAAAFEKEFASFLGEGLQAVAVELSHGGPTPRRGGTRHRAR